MRSKIMLSALCAALLSPGVVPAGQARPPPKPADTQPAAKCEHGVKKAICTRCNPKLAAVFKAKGDWCPEHDRPETQCVLCHPELAKAGVK